jgi:hypothetical protein
MIGGSETPEQRARAIDRKRRQARDRLRAGIIERLVAVKTPV